MEKGTLVEFRVNGDRRLAVIDRPEGKRDWIAIDQRGQAHKLHPREMTYTVTGKGYEPKDIPGFLAEIEPYLDPSSLEVAWELLVEDGEATDATGMALLLFSDQSAPLCYAAHCLLSDDKLFFKQKGDRYEPRPVTQVEELRHQIAVQQQKQHEWQSFLERTQAALAGESVEWQNSDRSRLETLEKYATLGEAANNRAAAIEVLTALGRGDTAPAAFQLLVDLKLWKPHENLFLRRSQIPTQFPSRVLDTAQSYLTMPPPDSYPNRLDLTHLKVYTIDDASTREIDDGLSLEYLEDGKQRIWIHIADPTRWLTPGDVLDQEARRRCTTLYLPTGMISMFPSELATGPMSLIQGEVCCSLSFAVVLEETGAIHSYEIYPTLVKPTYRLTYDDVDEMIELGVMAEQELLGLDQWARKRYEFRQTQGAITIRMPESSIKVLEDEVTIDVLEDSSARQLVAEMMILTGEVAGRYGQENQIPLPFRGQPQPELPPEEELLALPSGPVRDSAIRRCMPRSEMGITPIRHASLGLDTYTQVTSPIRRYTDLLAHFQIKAHLQGNSLPFSEEELKETLQSVSAVTYEATMVERQSNRYWGLEYLRRHQEEIWQSLMLRWLREHEGLGLILLEDLGLELAMRFDRAIYPGDRLEVKVSYVDPRQDIIHLTEVRSAVTQGA
ncbi:MULTISPECIES: ribonuclease R family protein [unclassified Leptolyngbya]|uniref:ribonuclease catalytic domain-containing protein n=1 Tax=unclassified Leptolyngbya TaxID=2650499 RepID=UPI001681F078|nr:MULTISPECIES: ribonuclease R family protein [unclassified Leptolyngbya]MBD1910622.1 VacB/RNase II family 3'-5' exoribonuclease [Leptolyngbya sp. FACHB-8]MBD2154562.1 VacB/RNase II family 3'-5' exoribonuclease [Leptolyngbya sp. FACHB-16]